MPILPDNRRHFLHWRRGRKPQETRNPLRLALLARGLWTPREELKW